MFNTDVNVYNEGNSFKFNVDAVSGTLHKSTRKSKFCVRKVHDNQYIFDDTKPRLTAGSEEIVVLQTMLTGHDQVLVEYMTRKDYDEMFDGPLPDVNVREMLTDIISKVKEDISQEESYDEMLKRYENDEDYYNKKSDRRWMGEFLAVDIVKKVCKYLADKHIGTFDFSSVTPSSCAGIIP